MPNTQIEEGDYVSLFKNSNAMIHDCSSFQIEYHYTHNPALYLCDDIEEHERGMNTFAKRAFELHYMGNSEQDIEQFINNVINEVDTKRDERLSFYNENLLPPYGKTASENIINAILSYNG
jgi:UDP-N-acetylglucosamine 2-epimerase